ncbi:cyclin b1 interacting protein 1 [Phytophthora cinnamomi]|uniref:cyclin b1 interacting protein 1 n=1 Tax=Phytophthora cinnamomi TaxID=4785 RepID=UPI003559C617|nr:cyclin b1 interacting protein 1 [Phytophthora cinnamomi]
MDDDSRMSETSSVRNRGQRRAPSPLGDLDGAGDAAALPASHIRPQLRCNSCWEPILPDAQSAETCYRTSCGHLFCVLCSLAWMDETPLCASGCSLTFCEAGEMRVQALRTGKTAVPRLQRRSEPRVRFAWVKLCSGVYTYASSAFSRGGGISETTIHGVADPKRTEAIWEEMMADPSSCFEHFQQALDFILFQLAQDSYRQVSAMMLRMTMEGAKYKDLLVVLPKISSQEEIRRQQAEEQKTFQIQHGEKYIQLKNYTDQLEAELRETKAKMQALTTSNDELREAYKEKSRKCRNWEKMCKTLKAQPSARQFPSPTRSTMGMPQQEGSALVTQASQFSRPSMRPMVRPYAVDGSSSSMRNPMASMGRPETPRAIQRPNVGMFERFSRPQIGGPSRPIQPLGGPRTRIVRPKTPLQASQRVGFISKRPTFRM